ncbi:MAG: dihydroorotate dehydrogenase [Bacteroidales bacterium]|nr:dihydroorotate dehydrogenase [Candidatus Cryptobacteroides aphodequi]
MVSEVKLCGVSLKNPVIPASGTFGFGTEMAGWYDLNQLGAISLKGTTLEPRFGNECPRIAECPEGLINSVGLQNPGIKAVLGEKIPALRKIYSGPVIANISGFSVEEYASCCAAAGACEDVDIIEVNISCPNVHGGGMAFGSNPEAAAEVTSAVKAVCPGKPVFVKLSPNVTDIAAIARACADAGADGLTLINTVLGMRIDLKTRRPVVAARYGGFSGRAILPIALRMVNQAAHACPGLPIMGCGGVSCADDVLEMMMAGATAVQVGAENLRDPMACSRIIAELPAAAAKYGIDDLNSIVGII